MNTTELVAKIVPGSRFAGSSEGLHCFRRPMASRRYERVAIRGVQLRQSLIYRGRAGRPSRRGALPVRHRDRLAEMGDRLLEGGAAQCLVTRLAPPFDGEIVETGDRKSVV